MREQERASARARERERERERARTGEGQSESVRESVHARARNLVVCTRVVDAMKASEGLPPAVRQTINATMGILYGRPGAMQEMAVAKEHLDAEKAQRAEAKPDEGGEEEEEEDAATAARREKAEKKQQFEDIVATLQRRGVLNPKQASKLNDTFKAQHLPEEAAKTINNKQSTIINKQ